MSAEICESRINIGNREVKGGGGEVGGKKSTDSKVSIEGNAKHYQQ